MRIVTERFLGRPIGEALCSTLMAFSLDLVGLISSYLVWGHAITKAQPTSIASWGSKGRSYGQLYGSDESAIAYNQHENTLWLTDFDRVQIFSLDGEFRSSFGWDERKNGECTGLAFLDGKAFIIMKDRHEVGVFTRGGKLLYTIGSGVGLEDGQLQNPKDVKTSTDGLVYVGTSEPIQDCYYISVFTREGKFVRRWGNTGHHRGPDDLNGISSLAINDAGEVFVATRYQNSVHVFVLCVLVC